MLLRTTTLSCLLLIACGDDAATTANDATATTTNDAMLTANDATSTATDAPTTANDAATTTATATDAATADTATTADTTTTADTATTADTTDAARDDATGPTCFTLPPGHTRHLVVARPNAEPDGASVDRWQVLPLREDGTLGPPSDTFTMARAAYGKVSFSTDGALGVAVGDRGELGVFALDEAGKVHVIEPGAELDIYPSAVQVDGDRLVLVDGNWQVNGGGIYVAPFGCDGSVGKAELLYPTKLAAAVALRPDGSHLVAAKEAVDTLTGALHVVSPDAIGAWQRRATAAPFDDVAILSCMAVTADGRFALVGDNQAFDDVPNRVGIISLDGGGATVAGVLSPMVDPYDIIVSPMNDAALVVTGFADDVRVLDYDATRDPPFIDRGPPTYVTQRPQLPGDAVLVGGAFPDLVFVAENQAIRRFRFEGDGTVTDLGRTAAGTDSYDAIPGAMGMQP